MRSQAKKDLHEIIKKIDDWLNVYYNFFTLKTDEYVANAGQLIYSALDTLTDPEEITKRKEKRYNMLLKVFNKKRNNEKSLTVKNRKSKQYLCNITATSIESAKTKATIQASSIGLYILDFLEITERNI